MPFIGEAVLSASVVLLIKKLPSKGLELFRRHKKLEADLIKWKKMLVMIQALLADAEDRKTKDESVKTWLDDLQNLAYDAEDVLDELGTEALRRELLLQEPAAADQPSSSANTSKFRKLIRTWRTNLSLRSFQFESKMVSKIKGITDRLQEIITTQKDLLNLKKLISDGKSKINVGQRLPTIPLVNEDKVYGREKDKEAIVELLLRDDLRADDGFSVISINGMGGVGKTTLAQLVYYDDRVQRHFEIKAQTCVSDEFDVLRVTKSILNSIDADQSNNDGDSHSLQVKLKKRLSGKKFLLVLDDVWNENYRDWSTLSCPFRAGAPGSKIVVTTRNLVVAERMRADLVYQLKKLSDDDCLCVLTQISLGARDFKRHQSLKEVGEQMVIKCGGLPLAAETLGGLLRGSYDPKYWEFVLKTDVWNLQGSDILPVLRVSYHFLPSQLKQCFAYCSFFPKDYEFEEEEIILLWTAEGFLDQDYNGRKMEDLGREFVRELHSRSLFQQSSNRASRFVMHDLINDLARWAAGEQYFRMEDTSARENRQEFSQILRHFSYICGRYDGDTRLEFICNVQHLRTFLPVNLSDYGHNSLDWSVLQMLLNHLPRLRVFSLCGYCNIFNLPNEIGNLKHLRCLNLSRTSIQILPDSINSLYNLHTILLEDCWKLKKLCNDMGNLKKLRHLKNSNVFSLEEMPKGFGRLTSLLTLCRFVVGKDSGSGLRELKSLTHLQGTLTISPLVNVKNDGDASEAQLNNKKNLKALFLEWRAWVVRNLDPCEIGIETRVRNLDPCEIEIETRVLSKLKPHRDVQELTIKGYGGTKFPIWLGDSSFSKLVHLTFLYCFMCTSLPSVGQLPLLKHLEISGMDRVKSVGSEFYGSSRSVPFQSLETLSFEDMREWEKWIPFGAGQEVAVFPKLRKLSLSNCHKLRGRLPERLLLLETLDITCCDQLEVTIQCLPALSELRIDGSKGPDDLSSLKSVGCKRVVFSGPMDLSSLKSVHLYCIANEVVLPGLFEQGLPKLESLKIFDVREQTYLWQSETRLLQNTEEEHDQQQPESLCRLQFLELRSCGGLTRVQQALLTLSSLTEMRINGCPSLVSFPEVGLPSRLRTIEIQGCNALESLPEAWMHNSNSSLESLTIGSCDSLVSFPQAALPSRLRTVKIKDCNALESLPEAWMHNSNSSLESLDIRNCNSLVSFPEVGLPSRLRTIEIQGCNALESLPEAWMHNSNSSLESLTIRSCNSLVSFPQAALPSRLRTVKIKDCNALESLPEAWMHNELPATLEHLEVCFCSNLALLSRNGNLPQSLKCLLVEGCSKLESLAERLDNTSLEEIDISNLENLKSLPAGLHNLHQLQKITIYNCENLKALPNCMHNLTSLLNLEISWCPSVVSFPEDGFPTNLHSLEIEDLKISKALFEWGLIRFTSLRRFKIWGGCPDLVSSPPFPTSLTELWISDMPNLESISSIGENLTSLKYLCLRYCPKLTDFPEQGLPKSLSRLTIDDCPLIEERCRKDEGKYWPMISHIPRVEING